MSVHFAVASIGPLVISSEAMGTSERKRIFAMAARVAAPPAAQAGSGFQSGAEISNGSGTIGIGSTIDRMYSCRSGSVVGAATPSPPSRMAVSTRTRAHATSVRLMVSGLIGLSQSSHISGCASCMVANAESCKSLAAWNRHLRYSSDVWSRLPVDGASSAGDQQVSDAGSEKPGILSGTNGSDHNWSCHIA